MNRQKRNGLRKVEASRWENDGLPTHISDSESRVELSKELLDAAKEIDGTVPLDDDYSPEKGHLSKRGITQQAAQKIEPQSGCGRG